MNSSKYLDSWLTASISHDLRSPFSSMVGVLQLLLDEKDKMPKDEHFDFLKDLLENSYKQLWLLDNLSFFAKVSRESFSKEKEHCELKTIILQGLESLSSFSYVVDGRFTVTTDGNTSLLSNSAVLKLFWQDLLIFLLDQEYWPEEGLQVNLGKETDTLKRKYLSLSINNIEKFAQDLTRTRIILDTHTELPGLNDALFPFYAALSILEILKISLKLEESEKKIYLFFESTE